MIPSVFRKTWLLIRVIAIPLFYVFFLVSCESESLQDPARFTYRGEPLSLERPFLFYPGDKPEFALPDYDDSSWDLLNPYTTWESYEKFADYRGIGWYRIRIQISEIHGAMGIIVPFHQRGLSLYVNGKFLMQTRPSDTGNGYQRIAGRPSFILIPAEYLLEGDNLFAFRTPDLDGYGGFRDPPVIGDFAGMQALWNRKTVYYLTLSVSSLILAVYHLLYYFYRKKDEYLLYYSLGSISISMFILGYTGFGLFIADHYLTNAVTTMLFGVLIAPAEFRFVHSFLSLPMGITGKIIEKMYMAVFLLIAGSLAVTGNYVFINFYILPPFYIMHFILSFYAMWPAWLGFNSKREYSLFVVFSMSVLVIAMIFQMLTLMDIIEFPTTIGEGYTLINLLFAGIMAHRHSLVHKGLETANEQLRGLDRLKDRFLANTSHELRTPVQGLVGIADYLKESRKELSEDEIDRNLNLISVSGQRLSRLVNDLLDYSAMKSGVLKLNTGPVYPAPVIRSAAEILKIIYSGKKTKIITECRPESVCINGDENRVYQIIYNLIHNSLRFTDSGYIKISVTKT